MCAHLGRAGVHHDGVVVGDGELRERAGDAVARGGEAEIRGAAVGVHPRVHFDGAGVREGHELCERIDPRVAPLCAREKAGPRLDRRAVDGVALGAHLKDDRVEPDARRGVDDGLQLCAELCGVERRGRGVRQVVHRRDPHRAKLPRVRDIHERRVDGASVCERVGSCVDGRSDLGRVQSEGVAVRRAVVRSAVHGRRGAIVARVARGRVILRRPVHLQGVLRGVEVARGGAACGERGEQGERERSATEEHRRASVP